MTISHHSIQTNQLMKLSSVRSANFIDSVDKMFYFTYFKLLLEIIRFVLLLYLTFLCLHVLVFLYQNWKNMHMFSLKETIAVNLLILHIPFY